MEELAGLWGARGYVWQGPGIGPGGRGREVHALGGGAQGHRAGPCVLGGCAQGGAGE